MSPPALSLERCMRHITLWPYSIAEKDNNCAPRSRTRNCCNPKKTKEQTIHVSTGLKILQADLKFLQRRKTIAVEFKLSEIEIPQEEPPLPHLLGCNPLISYPLTLKARRDNLKLHPRLVSFVTISSKPSSASAQMFPPSSDTNRSRSVRTKHSTVPHTPRDRGFRSQATLPRHQEH